MIKCPDSGLSPGHEKQHVLKTFSKSLSVALNMCTGVLQHHCLSLNVTVGHFSRSGPVHMNMLWYTMVCTIVHYSRFICSIVYDCMLQYVIFPPVFVFRSVMISFSSESSLSTERRFVILLKLMSCLHAYGRDICH